MPAENDLPGWAAEQDKEDEDQDDELYDDEYESDADPNVFKVRNPLPGPSAKLYTTEQLHQLIHWGTIDLNPPWQRDVVWTEAKQVLLIESIFRNLYIPPVVFAVTIDDEGEEAFICVDGKQRLTSIQKFLDGQLYYKDPKTRKRWYYTTPDSGKAEIPQKEKDSFAKKEITCVLFANLENGAEREIFQRVQLGVSLTSAEKLQAIDSPAANWIGNLVQKHIVVEGGLSEYLNWDTKRGRDFQCLAQLAYFCAHAEDTPCNLTGKVEEWISNPSQPSSRLKREIDQTLTNFWNLASNTKYNQAFTKVKARLAPIEFIFIGVLLYTMKDAGLSDMAKAAHSLRVSTRNSFRDVRLRNDLMTAMWLFIPRIVEKPDSSLRYEPPIKKRKSTGTKRKRGDESVDEDYAPSKGTVSKARK